MRVFAFLLGLLPGLAGAQVDVPIGAACDAVPFTHYVKSGVINNPTYEVRISTDEAGTDVVGFFNISAASNSTAIAESIGASADDAVQTGTAVVINGTSLALGVQASDTTTVEPLAAGGDDGQEATDGSVSLTGVTLFLGTTPGSSGSSTFNGQVDYDTDDCRSGLYDGTGLDCTSTLISIGGYDSWVKFRGVTVPADATINSAFMHWTASETATAARDTDITIHDTDSPVLTTGTIDALPDIGPAINWAITSYAIGVEQQSPDLKALVGSLLTSGTDTWDSGDDMAFIAIPDADDRAKYYAHDASPSSAARLEINYSYGAAADATVVALRFPAVDVPKDAQVISARVTFTADAADADSASFALDIENVDSSAALAATTDNISNRVGTGLGVNWVPSTWADGVEYQSADIAAAVEAVAGRTGWASGNPMTVLISGNGTRRAKGCDSGTCAYLTVLYTTGTAASAITGLRFQSVLVPAGATIISATLSITPDGPGGDPGLLYVRGIDQDDVAAFTVTSNSLSSLPLTLEQQAWSVDDWVQGVPEVSPDIALVLQEVIDRGGWASGQDLGLIITGNTIRSAYAYDGSASDAIDLDLLYTTSGAAGYAVMASTGDGATGNYYIIHVDPCPAGFMPAAGEYYLAIRATQAGDTALWSSSLYFEVQ